MSGLATREAMQQEEPDHKTRTQTQNDRQPTSEELDDEFSCE
jgi:hypothetical protein